MKKSSAEFIRKNLFHQKVENYKKFFFIERFLHFFLDKLKFFVNLTWFFLQQVVPYKRILSLDSFFLSPFLHSIIINNSMDHYPRIDEIV